MDGYDVQIIGYVAPILSGVWHIDPKSMGLVFAAGLMGLALGPLTFSPLADKFGCRRVLIGCTTLYALGTLATTKVDSWGMLLGLRLLTGLGLGGVLPCTVAVVSDFAPTRARNFMVAVSSSGFAIGGSLGGFVAAATLERFGWQSVFWIGGIGPLLMLPILLAGFPESLPRLLSDTSQRARLEKIVARLAPGWSVPEGPVPKEEGNDRFPVAVLFSKGLAVPTLLIWSIFICCLLLLYFFVNWIPTVVHNLGQPLPASNNVAALFQLAGLVGGFFLNHLADRTGRPERVLALAFAAVAVCCSFFGAVAETSLPLIVASVAATGFFVVGALGSCIAFAGTYYPPTIRATGIGWAIGVGRLGSILGPVVGGILLALNLSSQVLFGVFAIPAMLAVICSACLSSSSEQSGLKDDYAQSPKIGAQAINDVKG
jgi:benzoate transport